MTGPGLVNGVRFNGTVGQRISVRTSRMGFSGAVKLLKPDGSLLQSQGSSSPSDMFIDTMVLPSTGEYTVTVDPSGSQTGSSRVTVYEVPADQAGTLQPSAAGEAQTLSFATPGQNARLSFNGQAGEWVSLKGTSIGAASNVRLLKADGSAVGPTANMSTDGSLLDAVKLPATGGYLIDVNPTYGATGSITITAYSAGPPELVTPTAAGDERDIAVTGPGLVNGVRFNGTVGQRISVRTSSMGFSGAVKLLKPEGSLLQSQGSSSPSDMFIDTMVLPSTGEYTVTVDPSGSQTGSSRVTVYEVPADQAGTLQPSAAGEAQTLSFATPGQNARLSFNGQAGEWVSLKGTSIGAASNVRLLKADGSAVGRQRTCPPTARCSTR